MKKLLLILSLAIATLSAYADSISYKTICDVPYLETAGDDYQNERCKLDIYFPENLTDFPTIVFLHGGGLRSGQKFVPRLFKEKGMAVVAPNYRLFPQAKAPDYIEDAADAVAWTFKHIAEYGGNPEKIYVCGHSAGGYLTLMLALATDYLQKRGIDADSIKGYVSFSGQTCTHFTILKEYGVDDQIPLIDDYAPLKNVRKLGTHLLLLSGDREMEMLSRYTENLHLQEILNAKGNDVKMYELKGFNHQTMLSPSCLLLIQMILTDEKKAGKAVNMSYLF